MRLSWIALLDNGKPRQCVHLAERMEFDGAYTVCGQSANIHGAHWEYADIAFGEDLEHDVPICPDCAAMTVKQVREQCF